MIILERRRIGKSELEASILSMGTWSMSGGTWWGENDDNTSIKAIHAALDNGVTWVDTAPVYGFGKSEEVTGKALKDRRDKVILSTKCGLQWYDNVGSYHFSREGYDIYRDLSAKGIRRDVELSLKRLQTDYIDILYTHWQSIEPCLTTIEETMTEMMKLKSEGKIRGIGASNVTIDHIKEYMKYGQLDVIQEKYSMIDRKIELELLPFCEANNITLQTYSPIEQGLLSGKFKSDYKINKEDVREGKKWWKPENREIVVNMVEGWKDLAEKYNCTITNLVIAWTAMQSPNLNVLFGGRKPEQMVENLKAANIKISNEDMERMKKDADEAIALAK